MTTAGGNAAMTLDFMVNTTMLDQQLAAAEQKISRSASRITTQTEKIAQKWSSGMEGMLMKFAGPMFAVGVADKFARAFGDALKNNRSFVTTMDTLFYDIFSTIPVVGAITDMSRSYRMSLGMGGQTITSTIADAIFKQQIPVPEQLGGGVFRLGRGPGTGFQPGSTEMRTAQLQGRIERLQASLAAATPAKTFGELMSEGIAKASVGSMGQVQTALGTYRFMAGESAQADMVASVRRQVDIQMEIEKSVKALAELVKTAN